MPKKKEDEKREADVLAGKGSLADRLRLRRLALEAGDPEEAARVMREGLKIKKKKK